MKIAILIFRGRDLFWLFKLYKNGSATNASKKNNNMMSKEEALRILDLPANATKEQINAQYKRLMKKNHPDIGGSKHIATQLNEAKKTLLG